MKLHLPSGLRKALLACLAALSAALPPTLGSASGIAAAFAAASVMTPQQVAADEITVTDHLGWQSLFENVDGTGDNRAYNKAGNKVIIRQASTETATSLFFRNHDDTLLADLQFDTDLSLNSGFSNAPSGHTYTFSGKFTGMGSFKLTGTISHQHYVFTGDLSEWGGNFEITGGSGDDSVTFQGGDNFRSSHGSITITAGGATAASKLIVDGVTLDNSSITATTLQLKQTVTLSGGFDHAGQIVTITGETTFDTGSSLTLGTGANVTLTTVAEAGKTLTSLTMEEGTGLTVGSVAAAAAQVAAAAASTTEMTTDALTLNGAAAITLGDGVKLTATGVSGNGSLSTLTLGANAELSLGGSGSLSLTGAFTYGTDAALSLTGQVTIDLSEGGSLVAAVGGQKLTIDLSQDLLGQIANGKYHLFEGLSDEQRDLFAFTVGGQEADATHTNLRLDANGDVVWGAEYTWNGNEQTVTLSNEQLTTTNHWDKDGTLNADSAVTLNGQSDTEVTVTVGDGATMLTLTLTGSPTNYKFVGDAKTLTVSDTLTVEKSASFEGTLALNVDGGHINVGTNDAPAHLAFSGSGKVAGGTLTLRGDGTTVTVGPTKDGETALIQFDEIDLGAGTSLVLTGEQGYSGADDGDGWKTSTNEKKVHGDGSIVLRGLYNTTTGNSSAGGILWAFINAGEAAKPTHENEIGSLRLESDENQNATHLTLTAEMGASDHHGLGIFKKIEVKSGSSLTDQGGALAYITHRVEDGYEARVIHLEGTGNADAGALVLGGNSISGEKAKVFWGITADTDAQVGVSGSDRTLFGTVDTNGHTLTLKTDVAARTVTLVGNLVCTGTLALTGDGTVALGTAKIKDGEDATSTFSASGSGTITVGANTTLKNAQASGESLDMGSLTVSMNGGTLDVGTNGMTLSHLEGDTGTINSSATGALTLKDGEGEFGGTVSSALNYNAADGSYTVGTFSGSGALDVQAGKLTMTTLTASGNDVTVGNGTTLTVTGWTGTLGTLTLNGRLELNKGKLDVTSLTVGTDGERTVHIEMGNDTTQTTTFANGLLDGSVTGGKVVLEVDLEDIPGLTGSKYHLFADGSLTDAENKFKQYFDLTIVENSEDLSSNDCNRWEWTLDNDGYLTFTEKDDPSQLLTWTATGSEAGKETLAWKVGGTAAESGWDDQEIFREGDKVKFTADDTDANTVTLQGAITTGGVTVEKGVFNFGAKSGSETLAVTGDMTVNAGAEANIECSATVSTLTGEGTLTSGSGGKVTVDGVSTFTGTLGLNGGTITFSAGANTLGDGGKVRVEAGGGTLEFAVSPTSSLTATLESADGAGRLTLEGGSYTLSGETKGEVSLGTSTTLTGDSAGVKAAGVSGAATDATLGGKVTLTGGADGTGTYTYAGKLDGGLELTVTGGAHDDTLADQTITSLDITGGSLTWNGNLTMGKLDGSVDLGKAGNTLTLNGDGGGTYTGVLTLGTLDVQTGTHTITGGTIGTLKVAAGSTLTSAGGNTQLTVKNVLNGDENGGTVELADGVTLSLADGANRLGTLEVSGPTANTLTLAGGSLATALDGIGTLNVMTTGAGASLTLDRGTSGEGVTVNLGDKTELTGNGTTLKSVTGTGTITATDLSLTGATPAPATGFSGVIDASATVTLNESGNWELSNGARVNGTLTTNGTLTLDGKVTLNHQMIVGATGSFAGTGTLDIQLANEAAETAGGAIKWGGEVSPGQVGNGIRITFSGDAAINDNTRWEYQLFNDLSGASFGASDWDAFRKAVLGVLGQPSEAHKDWSFELSQDGVLSINPATDTQQWLEGDTAFTWKDADGESYNKWTVGEVPEQVFSSEQNVEFAGTSTDPITVTVEGDINIAGHDMEVRQGEGVQGAQSYTFVLKNAEDKLTVTELSVGQGVTTDFNVGSGSVTASATVVDGKLVLSGSGTRSFGDVTVNDGASVRVKQGGNVSGKVHGDGTLYFDWTGATGQQTEAAFRSLVSAEEGHTLAKAEIVGGTSLELSGAESAAPLGRVKNLTVETGANLTVSSADAIAGANPSVHLAGAGVNNSGALAVTARGTVSMNWGITLDADASVSVGSGSTLQYGGKLDFGTAAEGQENNKLTKTGAGTLELSDNYARGTAAGNFHVQQGTLKFSYTKSPDIEANGTVTLAEGATMESTITGTLGTLSGNGALKVSDGELTVKDLSGARLQNVEFSNGGMLHVGTNTLTGGGTLTVGAGGGTLDIVLTGDGVTNAGTENAIVNGGNILNFSALKQTGGSKVTLHLTGYEQFYNSSSIESDEQFTASLPPSYQLFEAENFKKLWEALHVGSDEGWWKPYFDIEVEITNRLVPELSTDGLLTFTKDVGFVWKGGGDNTWSAGHTGDSHWMDGKAPEAEDNVTFDGAGQGDVFLDGEVRAKDVWVESGNYTFTGKGDNVKGSLTVTDGNLVVQKDASLNLNVELKGIMKDTLVVLQGDDKARGTLNVQENGVLGENTHVKFVGGQLRYDSSSTTADLSDRVLADESTSGVRVLVEGADARGTTWGNTVGEPTGGVKLALEKGIEKSGDGQFTLRWKDSTVPATVHQGLITVTDGKLTLDVTAEFPHSKSELSGDVRLDGELDVRAHTQVQPDTRETGVELSGAVDGTGTLKATSGRVGLTGDLSKFSGSVAADGASTCLVLSGNAVAGGTVGAAVSGNGGTVAVDGGNADVTLTGKVSGTNLTLRNDGSGELFVSSREPGNGSGTKLDGGKGGITLGSVTGAVTWAGSQVTGGVITLSNVTLGQGGFTGGKGGGGIYVDTVPVPTTEVAPVAAENPQGGIVDVNGMNVGTLDGIAVNAYGTLRGLNGGSYTVGAGKALSLFFTPQNAENNTWSETAAEPKGQALIQGSGFTVELAAGNATANDLQLAFDYSVIRWFREHNSLYVRALDGGTWTHEGTVLDWMEMTDNVAQLMQVIVGTNYTFTDDGLQMNGSAKDLYVVMDDAATGDPEHSVTPEDLREKRATVVLDGKTLTLDWDGATVKDAPDGRIPNLLGGDEGTRLVIRNTADSSRTTTNRLEVEVDNTLREVRDGRFEDENGMPHLPEADGTHVQGEDTTFLGSVTGELGVDLTKSGKGTLTVGGNYSMTEGTTKLKEGALVLRGGINELKDLEFAYMTAQDTENNEKRRGLEVTGGGKTTVSGMIKESNGGGFSGDISVTQGAELVLQDESTLQSTGITGDNSGTLTLDGEASLTLAGDGKPEDPQLSGITVQVGTNATLDTGRDQSELTALNGNGTLESNEGGKVTVHGGSFSGTLAPGPSADGGNPNAGTLKLADGASFTFDNAGSAAGSSEDPGAWDVELGKGVNLSVKVDKKSGSDSDCFTLGHITLGNNNLTVDFGTKPVGENYFAATLADIKSGSLTFNSDGMVKGNTHVDTGVSLAEGDQAAWNAFKDRVHFTGAGNFLTEQNVHTEGGKVIIDYSEATDNKLLGERGIPGAGKNGRAGAGMVWDSLKDKSQSQAFFDALMNPGSDFYRMGSDLIRMYENGDTAGMERGLTSVAGASIATLGPALAQDIHRQLKSIRNRSTSMSVEKGADDFNPSLIRHAWINGESGYYKLERDGYLPGFTLNSWGGTVGVDMNVSSNTVFALAVSAMYGDLKPHAAETADGSLDTTWLSGVVHTTRGPWIHTFVLSGGLADAEINRTVNYGSGSYRTSGSTDGYALGALYEVGYTHLFNKEGRTALQPIANIEWRHVSLDGYTEGGSDAGLSVNKISQDVVTLGAGARLQTIVGANWVNHATLLETRALVKADIGDRSGTAENALVGMGNKGRGEVETAEVGSVGIEVGAGVTVPLGPRAGCIFADASVEWRSGWTAFDATVGYKISF